MIASPNLWFDPASFLTKNGILNIAEQLGLNTKNLDRPIGGLPFLASKPQAESKQAGHEWAQFQYHKCRGPDGP